MAREKPLVGLGDLLRADEALRPADALTRARLSAFLQISLGTVPNEQAKGPPVVPRPPVTIPLPSTPMLPTGAQVQPSVRPTVVALPSVLEVVEAVSFNKGDSEMTNSEEAIEFSASSIQKLRPEMPQQYQLFRPLQERSILSVALATYTEDGPLDSDRLIEAIARGEVLQKIFRIAWPTLRRGIQLLIDRSDAMMPFAEDQEQLLHAIQLVAGIDKTAVMGFAGSPKRGTGEGPITDWKTYQSPPPGTLVVLISDLGIGRGRSLGERADVSEWHAFALDVRRAGCRLVAFVPYAQHRWSTELQPLLTMIPWDRSTTANTIRSLMMSRSKERR